MKRYRAERPGQLPVTADAIVGGVRLPSGKPIIPDREFAADEPNTEPVLWISDDAVPGIGAMWCELAESFAHHGLWPLVLESLDGADARPWHEGELDPALSTNPDDHDAATVLAESWVGCMPASGEIDETLLPFGATFPGLAAPTDDDDEPEDVRDHMAELEGRLGLVATLRPSDAPAVLGWTGPMNHESDMGKLAAVMRSWEDRFGAYLVGLGFDTMTFFVQRPPSDLDQATAIAAEHFAFCPDNVWQGSGSLASYAEGLFGATFWTFWWD